MSAHGFKADRGASFASIERAAYRTRKIVAPGSITAAVPGMALLENLDQHWANADGRRINLNYGVSDIRVEALTRYDAVLDQMIIVVSERTYRDLAKNVPRARFALCHEIGHAVLHFDQAVRLAGIPHQTAALMRGSAPKHPPYLDTEWQANAFASSLLMPAKGLAELEQRGGLSISMVQFAFGVSYSAAGYRLVAYNKRRAELLSAVDGTM